MLKKLGEPAPPKGLRLKLFRAPLYFYRLKAGFLLGDRFIRLKHWGRKSGELKETVIEVIDQNRSKARLYSASGFGEKSQWFKNISENGSVWVTQKNHEYRATARVLSEDEAIEVMLRYLKAHPKSIKAVAKLSGYEMDGTEQDVIEFSSIVRIVEFTLLEEA